MINYYVIKNKDKSSSKFGMYLSSISKNSWTKDRYKSFKFENKKKAFLILKSKGLQKISGVFSVKIKNDLLKQNFIFVFNNNPDSPCLIYQVKNNEIYFTKSDSLIRYYGSVIDFITDLENNFIKLIKIK